MLLNINHKPLNYKKRFFFPRMLQESSLERGRRVSLADERWTFRGNTQECLVNMPVALKYVCQRCLQGVDVHTLAER